MLTGWSSASDVAKENGSIAVVQEISCMVVYVMMRAKINKRAGLPSTDAGVRLQPACGLVWLMSSCYSDQSPGYSHPYAAESS